MFQFFSGSMDREIDRGRGMDRRRKRGLDRRWGRMLPLECLETRITPSTSTWTGMGGNSSWMSAANWNTAPVAGDDLVFPDGPTNLQANNNFPAGTSFASITIAAKGYTLSGDALGLTGAFGATYTSGTSTDSIDTSLGSGTISVAAGGTLALGGMISSTNGLSVSGGGTLDLLGDNTSIGLTTVNGAGTTLLVDGTGGAVQVNAGAVLGGSGGVGNVTSTGGTVSPGHSPSVLNTGSLTLDSNSTFVVGLDGTIPGNGTTGYDQVVSDGGVNLGGAKLSRSIGGGYTPTPGDQLTIIDNTSGPNVTGTFAGLAEGADFTISGFHFRITYQGGSSQQNVVLTAVAPSTTTISTSTASSTYGDSVTFTAHVSGGLVTPTGTVDFYDGDPSAGGTLIDAASVNSQTGDAVDTTSAFKVTGSPHQIFATYIPDAQSNYAQSATTQPSSLTVNPAPVTVTGVTASSRVYDTTNTDTLNTASAALSGVVTGDHVTLATSGATGSFADKIVGTAKPVTVSGLTISGADAGNYTLVQPTGLTADITTATVTAALTGIVEKTYDGTTAATLAPANYQSSGVLGSDTVILNDPASGTYDTSAAGTPKMVSVTGLALSGADAGNYVLASNAISGAVGQIDAKALTVTGVTVSDKVYNATTTAALDTSAAALSGVVNSDVVNLDTSGAIGSFADKNVGTAKPVTVSGLTISGAGSGNYTLVQPTGFTASITAAPLTVSGVTANDKVYDGTTADTLDTSAAILSGVLGSDVVGVSPTGYTATFADKNVATGKPVTVVGLGLTGTDAGNYTLAQPSGLTADITSATVTAALTGIVEKTYDGTNAATLAPANYLLSGVLGSDNVILNDPASGTYDTAAAGTGKTITVPGLVLSGADSGNYVLASDTVAGARGQINAKALTVTGVTAKDKVYDGTTTDTLDTSAGVLSGVIGSDVVDVSPTGYTATFGDKIVGTAKPVTVVGLGLTGADSGNYTLVQPTGLTANITPATVTASLTGIVEKTYDGTTAATLVPANYQLAGVVNSDDVALNTPASGTYDTKDVGTGKTVGFTGLVLSGTDAGNYVLASNAISGAVGQIDAKALTVTGVTASDKVYNATTTAALDISAAALSGVLNSDAVTLDTSGATGSFADKNVGTAKPVTVSGLTISGADAGNYTLVQPTGVTASITAAPLTVSGVTANDKSYDGTTGDTLDTSSAVLSGVLGSDVVSVSPTGYTATFADKNVMTAIPVTVVGLGLTGTDAGNYTLAQPTGLTANITTATVTASLTGVVEKTYDGTTPATLAPANYQLSGVFGSDVVILNDPASGTYDTAAAGTGKTVTVTGLAISGADAGNYVLASDTISAAVGQIDAKALTVTGVTANDKVYDGTTADTLDTSAAVLSGLIGSDVVGVSSTGYSATFADKNVGTAKPVTVVGLGLSVADSGNYTLDQPTGLTADITIASVTAALTGLVEKTYDGTTAATLCPGNYQLSGVANSDNVSLNDPASGTYDTEDVGTAKMVSVTGLVLSGTDSGNYVLASNAISGDVGQIDAKALSVTGVTVNDKVYNGTTADTLNLSVSTLSGVLSGDLVTLINSGATATLADKNVGTAKPVTVEGLTISGADSGNYTLVQPTGLTANITAATVTASLTGIVEKTYDGTVAATLAPDNYQLSGVLDGDAVILNDPASGTYNTKNVGPGKTVSVSGLALSGAGSGNYVLASNAISGAVGQIAGAVLTVTDVTANNKVYNGTTADTLNTSSASLSGVIGSDVVNLVSTGATASFADKNIGTAKPVTVNGITISGADSGNYLLAQPTGLTANITPATVTASLTGVVEKTYDGTTNASLLHANYQVAGVVNGDTVTLNDPASGTFATKSVGTGRTVGVSGLALSGADSGNYVLASNAISGAVGKIDAKALTLTGVTASDKVYDGTTTDTLNTSAAALSGVATGDAVTLNTSGATASFADQNAGTAKPVTVAGLALSGADAGNYTFAQPTGLTASITPEPLTITPNNASKVFGTPLPAFTVGYSGFVNGESNTNLTTQPIVTTSATSTSPAGVYGLNAAGASSSNYKITSGSPGTLVITKAGTSATLSNSISTSVVGQTTTFTVQAAAVYPGVGNPTGLVTFASDGAPIGTAAVNPATGTATLSTTTVGLGTHTITASYSGDSNFQSSQSNSTQEIVSAANTQAVLTAQAVRNRRGQITGVNLVSQVQVLTPGGGFPGGVITYFRKGHQFKTAVLTQGTSTLKLKPNQALNQAFTIQYSGSGSFHASSSASLKVTQKSLKSSPKAVTAFFVHGHAGKTSHGR